MQLLVKIAAVCALLALTIVVAAWFFQRKLIYFPNPSRHNPAAIGLTGIEEVVLTRADGVRVVSWYGKAQPGQPTLLYFHGNGGNLAGRAERVAIYQRSGFGIFMMSYRGYSGSTGSPTETANVGDALAAYDEVRRRGTAANDIVIYGESLGTGVGVQVATQRRVAGIILDSPYTSLADVGARAYPFLPVHLAIADRYDSLSKITRLNAPLLIIHGEDDQVVPYDLGRALFAAANEPKTFAGIAAADHNNHSEFGSYEIILNWLEELRRPENR